jgi:hypothetical protein
VSERDSSIPLSDFVGYDDVPAASERSSFAGCPMRGPRLDPLFQISMIFEQGAARVGD